MNIKKVIAVRAESFCTEEITQGCRILSFITFDTQNHVTLSVYDITDPRAYTMDSKLVAYEDLDTFDINEVNSVRIKIENQFINWVWKDGSSKFRGFYPVVMIAFSTEESLFFAAIQYDDVTTGNWIKPRFKVRELTSKQIGRPSVIMKDFDIVYNTEKQYYLFNYQYRESMTKELL